MQTQNLTKHFPIKDVIDHFTELAFEDEMSSTDIYIKLSYKVECSVDALLDQSPAIAIFLHDLTETFLLSHDDGKTDCVFDSDFGRALQINIKRTLRDYVLKKIDENCNRY